MENKELEEMRAQLATLNEKLENEGIVDEKHFNEATRKHLSELQRILIRRIILLVVLLPVIHHFGGLIFGLWCLGAIILNIHVYRVVRKGNTPSICVAEYVQQLRNTLKTFKRSNRFMWFFTIAIIMLLGIVILVTNLNTEPKLALVGIVVCSFFAIAFLVAYFITNVALSPKIGLMLEMIIGELEPEPTDSTVS